MVHSYPQDNADDGVDTADSNGGAGVGVLEEIIHDVIELEPTTEAQPPTSPQSTCNVVGLIKCFSEVLDDWMLHLWNFQKNIITVNRTACEHHKNMEFCVNYPSCTSAEWLNVSRMMTEMILHRKGSGSFLKSYYFTQYACTHKGQEIVDNHRPCLINYKINEKSMVLSRYMEDVITCKIAGKTAHECRHMEEDNWDSDEWYCEFLKTKANDMYIIAKDECGKDPAFLMCKGINDIFVNLYPEQLQNCQVPCAKIEEPTPQPENGKASSQDGNKSNTGSASLYKLSFYLVALYVACTSFISHVL